MATFLGDFVILLMYHHIKKGDSTSLFLEKLKFFYRATLSFFLNSIFS